MSVSPAGERIALLVHEVRSPTAALAAIATALEETEVDDESLRAFIGLALAACRGIERVVGDAALGPLDLDEVDVGDVARSAVAAAALTGAHVECAVAAGSLVVEGDALRLRQALDNLVANAVTHGGWGGEIRVDARNDGDTVLLSVSDDGVGVAPEHQERIFEPGVRLDPSRPGSGLGLAVARAIVESHGGRITVESCPGEGATFTIALRTPKDASPGP
jgi:signal transduction histidine kinase